MQAISILICGSFNPKPLRSVISYPIYNCFNKVIVKVLYHLKSRVYKVFLCISELSKSRYFNDLPIHLDDRQTLQDAFDHWSFMPPHYIVAIKVKKSLIAVPLILFKEDVIDHDKVVLFCIFIDL